ncbi:MAG: hypothetical protein RLO21_12900 [Nitratireductor sp.]
MTLQEVFQIDRRDPPFPADIYRPQIAGADPVADRGFPDFEEFRDVLHSEELP